MLEELAAMERLGYASPSMRVTGTRIDGGSAERVEESLAEETPVTVAYNLVPHAVMMATPADLQDFPVGFSLTEGIVARAEKVQHVEMVRHGRGIELQIDVPADIASAAASSSRRLSGRTGCGICGMEDVERVLRELPAVRGDARIESTAIARAMRELAARQPLNDQTGAVHAAGWARADGTLVYVREDVGGFVVMPSRGSFELVQKAAILGVPLLATVSAPTALAVRVAEEVGMTLVGVAREERVTGDAGGGTGWADE